MLENPVGGQGIVGEGFMLILSGFVAFFDVFDHSQIDQSFLDVLVRLFEFGVDVLDFLGNGIVLVGES